MNRMKIKSYAIFCFCAASICELFSNVSSTPHWYQYTKPFIMPSLGIYYFLSVKWNSTSALVLAAILFSFLGDSFLMYEAKNEIYFMLGLGSFLLAHIFYVIAYPRHREEMENDQLANVHIVRMAIPVLMAGTGLIVILYPALGELRVPVVIYALVLMFMVLQAIFRYRKTTTKSFVMVFAGALLFMISDSLLAVNKFIQPIQGGDFFIMSTYILAQLLIIQGLIFHAEVLVEKEKSFSQNQF
jgi:uncharacterized membrane protein YhhN